MNFFKFKIVLFVLITLSANIFAQTNTPKKVKDGSKQSRAYNVNISLGEDNVPASLKIDVIGDNLQIYRNIGSNNWDYQYYEWSDHPGRGIHLYIDGSFYYTNYSTDIYVDGVPAGSNLSYFEDSYGIPYDRIDITRIDDYNATVKIVKANVIEAFLNINYPPESDYINYTWTFTNNSGSTMNDIRFFQAGDTYSYGSDYGFGYWDAPRNTVGCQKMDNGELVSVFLEALEVPFQHESAKWGFSSGVESHVMNNALTGDVFSYSHDNSIALEWRTSLANGESWEIHTIEKYSDKDITNLIVTAPLNETIHQGETKYMKFSIRNNSNEIVSDISLAQIIDQSGWTLDIVNPTTLFTLAPTEEIDADVKVVCPIDAIPGTIAKTTLKATANGVTADDKAYVEVLSILPNLNQQPVDQDVCLASDAATFSIVSDTTATAFQWQKLIGVWTNVVNTGAFSGANTDTLHISDATGLIGVYFRCQIANGYGDVFSDSATIILDYTAPVPDAISLPDIIEECTVFSLTPPTATDECEGSIIGTTDAVFPITDSCVITWTFEDTKGNKSYLVQDVIINDITAPVPEQNTLPDISELCSATITTTPTAIDNCDGVITGTTTAPLYYDTVGTYIITWKYEDDNGNSTTQDQTIYVSDSEPIALTKDTTITMTSDTVVITPADIDNGSYDVCGTIDMSLDKTIFTIEDEGENTVNLTVVDDKGQSSTKSAIVTIIYNPDSIDYTIVIPNFISPNNDGKNDFWEIEGIRGLNGYTLDIFNNIGGVVYHTENYDNTWNAMYEDKELPDGTYYYIFKSGESTYSGFISVIR